MTDEIKELYRYEAYPEYGGWEGAGLEGVRIELRVLPVHRVTRCGVWASHGYGSKERWISLTGRKRYAYPDKELAMASFKIRNARYIMHLERNLHHAMMAKKAIDMPDLYQPSPESELEALAP